MDSYARTSFAGMTALDRASNSSHCHPRGGGDPALASRGASSHTGSEARNPREKCRLVPNFEFRSRSEPGLPLRLRRASEQRYGTANPWVSRWANLALNGPISPNINSYRLELGQWVRLRRLGRIIRTFVFLGFGCELRRRVAVWKASVLKVHTGGGRQGFSWLDF